MVGDANGVPASEKVKKHCLIRTAILHSLQLRKPNHSLNLLRRQARFCSGVRAVEARQFFKIQARARLESDPKSVSAIDYFVAFRPSISDFFLTVLMPKAKLLALESAGFHFQTRVNLPSSSQT